MNTNTNNTNNTNTNNTNTNNIISFYIPRISTKYSEEDVINIFYLAYIGDVKRVDFTPIIPKDSTENQVNTKYQSAFVHMNFMYNDNFANKLYTATYVNNTSYKFNLNQHEFWLILKNRNPIPETNLNIHQVVENARLLEEKVLSQEKLIQDQQKTIEVQTGQIERIQQTINQLTGICFDHEKEINKQKKKVTHGNFNYLIHYMFTGLDYVEDQDQDQEDQDQDKKDSDSDITYTNMPELISLDSEDEEKDGSSDDSAKERIRFSNDCCDNF